jgi:RNA polymerase I-specific transcription initiation factor RRN7
VQIICRDLWALHLSLIPSPPPAEPYFHAQEVSKEGRDSIEERTEDLSASRDSGHEEDMGSDPSEDESSSTEDKIEDEEDRELAALLRENSESSSSSEEGEGDKSTIPKPKPPAQRNQKTSGPQEVLASTVAVLMLACWTMRIPVIYLDFVRLVVPV